MATEHSDLHRTLSLKGFGAPATPAAVVTRRLSLQQRFGRGGRVMGLGLASALLMLPIPIIHLIGPPIAILLGLTMGIRRLAEGEIFVSADGNCPFCHTAQPLGLAGSRFRLPCDLICSSCRQPLRLEAAPEGTRPV